MVKSRIRQGCHGSKKNRNRLWTERRVQASPASQRPMLSTPNHAMYNAAAATWRCGTRSGGVGGRKRNSAHHFGLPVSQRVGKIIVRSLAPRKRLWLIVRRTEKRVVFGLVEIHVVQSVS